MVREVIVVVELVVVVVEVLLVVVSVLVLVVLFWLFFRDVGCGGDVGTGFVGVVCDNGGVGCCSGSGGGGNCCSGGGDGVDDFVRGVGDSGDGDSSGCGVICGGGGNFGGNGVVGTVRFGGVSVGFTFCVVGRGGVGGDVVSCDVGVGSCDGFSCGGVGEFSVGGIRGGGSSVCGDDVGGGNEFRDFGGGVGNVSGGLGLWYTWLRW